MGIPIVLSSFPEYLVEVDRCLAQVDALGLRWRATRFGRYRSALEEAATASYPRVVDVKEPAQRERDRLLREAAIQTQQLMVSSETWDEQSQHVLTSKLKIVLKGRDLPSTKTRDDDRPRNTLAELATAALLRRYGFQVSLTEKDEDVLASVPELQPFAIECKRPASEAAIESNLRIMRSQLRKRCKAGDRYGFAVLAVDRLLGVSGGMLHVHNEDQLQAGLDRKLRSILGKLRALVTNPARPELHLYPTTRLVGCLFVGTVFLQDPGRLVTIGLLAAASATPDHAVEASFVIDVVERYMGR